MSDALHGRQIRLAEVGEEGQARLEAAEVVLGSDGEARIVEATYLHAAGTKVREAYASHNAKVRAKLRIEDKVVADAVKALGIVDSAARDVAIGALRALVAIRSVLGIGAPDAASGTPKDDVS